MESNKDRLSILEKIERGELSIEDAEAKLGKIPEEPEAAVTQMEEMELTTEEEPEKESEEAHVHARRESKLALAEKFQNWQPPPRSLPKRVLQHFLSQ